MNHLISPKRSRVRCVAPWLLPIATFAVALQVVPTLEAQSGAPLAPTLIHSSVGTRASFVWAPNPQGPAAAGFVLQAGSGPGLSNLAVVSFQSSQTSFAADAPPGVYYVRVIAVNGAGASAPSNEVVVTLSSSCTPPGPPTGVIATPSGGSVTIRWNSPASGGAPTAYALDVGSGPGLSNLGTFALPNTTTITSPAPPGQYFVRVRALNACGSSGPSLEASFTIGAVAPVTPLPAGVYNGVMSGNMRPGLGRPPITSFQLTLNQPTPTTTLTPISGRWSDNAGCVRTNPFLYAGVSNGVLLIDVESLTCNDGDLILRVTGVNGNVVQGTCNGGPACAFSMVRQ